MFHYLGNGYYLNAKDYSMKLVFLFKKLIESTGMYDPFIGKSGKIKEKNCQNLFYLFSKVQFSDRNFDLSPECNQGRGPSDFKVSCGNDNKCIIEMKLLSASNCVKHGLILHNINAVKLLI